MIEYFDIRLKTQCGEVPLLEDQEKYYLRELARKVTEIGNKPIQENRKRLWRLHNNLKGERPMVLIFPEGCWSELLPYKQMKIQKPFWHELEWYLRRLIYRDTNIPDDYVVEPVIEVPLCYSFTEWMSGVNHLVHLGDEDGKPAAGFKAVIEDERDYEKMTPPRFIPDIATTIRNVNIISETVGSIIPVSINNSIQIDTSLIMSLMEMRSMEQLLIDMIEIPERIHQTLMFMQVSTLKLMEEVENSGLMGLNNGNDYVGSGGVGYTNELPGKDFDGHVRYSDLWGFSETQDLSSVSPTMYNEFALQYQIPLLDRYGLNCYGCCEPMHDKIEIVKKIPRLRRISVSPWCDLKIMSESFNRDCILSWKPSPMDLANKFDEENIRKTLLNGIKIAKDNCLEIIMKDTHTVQNEKDRISRWVKMANDIVEDSF